MLQVSRSRNTTKMKLVVYLNFILFYVYLTKATDYANTYLSLVKTIRSFYSASSVIFLYPVNKNLDSMKTMYTIHTWSYILEQEQITTMSLSIKDIHMLTKYYTNISRPLIINLLIGSTAIHEFSSKTKSIKMSNFAWLVVCVSTASVSMDECKVPQGNPFNLSFDTEMLVMSHNDNILREWYSLDGETTEMYSLFKWQNATKESPQPTVELLSNLSLYERRNDLRGKVLRGVTVGQSVLLTYENNKLGGYFSAAIRELEMALNFTLDVVAKESQYGSFNMTTKRWSGALRLVASKMVDIGVSDFSMTNIRLDYVDYLAPIIATKSCLFLKKPDIFSVRWFAYLKAFSSIVWMSIFTCCLVSICTLTFLRSRIESSDMIRGVFCEEIFRILGVMCQQGLVEFPRHTALKIAYCTLLLTAFVITTAYSASLIGFLTSHVRDIPFRTIDEFFEDGTYKVIVLRGTADFDMLFNSKDPWSLKIRPMLKPRNAQPYDIISGFKSLCNTPNAAYYCSYSKRMKKVAVEFHIPCQVDCLSVGRTTSLSLVLPKGSQYTDALNYHLKKLLNSGLLNRYMRDETDEEGTNFQPVGFSSVASVLLIFMCGVALSFLLLSIEICCNKCRKRYIR
ncbi:glutamate receptor 1-like [Osmia bicornis bicornis]|uniref:glutamate receptor 1-like n=1 Tax=Osmia bicornis bicornis TaxID=1437191 RepID=UPI001EAF683E|nr:glutamate receptor 1-like [Osmia bicornis bicornis]